MDDGFPVVVILGLAIFGMIWIGSEAGNGFNLGTEQPENRVLLSENPGTIGESNEDFRTIGFGDFTVGETRGNVQAYTSERDTISNGILSGDKVLINYNATQPGQGQINFEVLGRQSKGQIYVKVNGNEVFKSATISGADPTINISRNNFRNGINEIIIGTTQSSLLEKSVYSLEDVEVTVRDRKFHDYTNYFQMYQHELNNFRPSNLTFNIPVDASVPQEPLEINVNDQTVFSQTIGRSTQGVTITPQNADLSTGYNTINFGTDGESKYTVKNAEIQVRYAVNTRPAQKRYNFNLDEEELNYAQRDDTDERLEFDYQQSSQVSPVTFELNDQRHRITPENGENTVEISDDTLQRENSLSLNSNQTFTVRSMELVSEKVEN